MKTTKLFFMAALALTFAACSNDDNNFAQQPQKAEGITITAQLAPKTDGATTRAVEDKTTYIEAKWAENEHIAILYEVSSTKYVADATITAVDGSGTATITFTVEAGTPNNTACTLVYPLSAAKDDHTGVKDAATLLAAQDGTLSANLDVRVGAGTIQTTTPGLTVTTQPEAQFAIFKFTVKNSDASATINVKPLQVTIGAQNYVITPASATSELFAALPPISSEAVTFTATGSDSKTYTCSKASVSFDAGKYYQSTLKMAEAEKLLTTITATAKEQASYSTANVATVSFSYTSGGSSDYLANWGWWGYGWIATVTAAEGYTITKCIFYDDANRTATDSKAPFVVETIGEEDKTPRINGTPIDGGNMWSKGIMKIEVYGYVTPSASSGPEVAWDKAKKTGSFTMPGGNVTLEPEYYPQATVADGGVTAADADARATTDDPLVKVDATKLTGAKKLMYFVSNSGTTAPAYDAEGWTDQLPTAEGFTQQGIVYVWYYPVGIDEGVDDATATYSDGDICLQSITARIGAAPTYTVTFAEGMAEPTLWTASPATDVEKGQTVIVTYTGTKKVIGVKAEKKGAGPLAAAFKDGAKFKVGYQWNFGYTTYLEFTNSGGTYSLTSVSGLNEANGFNSSTLTVKNGNVLALDVVCQPNGDRMDDFCAQIEFDATSSTYKYSSKGSNFTGIISVSVNDTDITSQLTEAK